METRFKTCFAISASFVLLGFFPSSGFSQGKDFKRVEYTVKAGDTCWSIAKKLYGDPWKYKEILKGKSVCPDKIAPGQILLLPHPEEVAKVPDAQLSYRKGKVSAKSPKNKGWFDARIHQDLWRAWQVDSSDRSRAQVTFTKNGAKLDMRENTLIIIYGPESTQSQQRAPRQAVLERGTLRSRLSELAGQPELHVETNAAKAKIEGGEVLISVRKDKSTIVANHTSKKVELSGKDQPSAKKKSKKKRKKVVLVKNMGSRVEPGKDPTPPKPLPSPPKLSALRTHAVFAQNQSLATLAWNKATDADFYRIELSQDLKGSKPLDTIKAAGNILKADFRNLKPGTYFARISTTDKDGFEGIPSEPVRIDVRPLKIANEKTLTVGTSFEAPDGLLCTFDESEPRKSLLITKEGKYNLRCLDAASKTWAQTPLNIQQIKVVSASIPESEPVALQAGDALTLEFTLDQRVERATLIPPDGVKVISTTHDDKKQKWSFKLYSDTTTPMNGEAKLIIGAKLGSGDKPIRQFPINVAPLKQTTSRRAVNNTTNNQNNTTLLPLRNKVWALGAYINAADLFRQNIPRPIELRQAWRAGARLQRTFEGTIWGAHLELEGGALYDPAQSGQNWGSIFGLRVGPEARWSLGNFTPFARLSVGADLLAGPRNRFFPTAHIGAGAEYQIVSALGVRLDLKQELWPVELPTIPPTSVGIGIFLSL